MIPLKKMIMNNEEEPLFKQLVEAKDKNDEALEELKVLCNDFDYESIRPKNNGKKKKK